MTTCNKCNTCDASSPHKISRVVIVGNLNVGKTSLFARLTGTEAQSLNVPGSTVSLQAACMKQSGQMVYDTPGTYSVFAKNDDEVASRDALLMAHAPTELTGILLVADAKNLKRSVAMGLQYGEYGLPMMMVINMIDEAPPRGIQIDVPKLSELLGIEIVTTVAREGFGVQEVAPLLSVMRIPPRLMTYPPRVEQFISLVEKLLQPSPISPRILGVLLFAEDHGVEEFVKREFGPGMLDQLKDLASDFRREEPSQITATLSNLYLKKAEQIAGNVVTVDPPPAHPFARKLGDWCVQYHTGIPIALLILFGMYLFVGSFGAVFLVDLIEKGLFKGFIIPLVTKLVQPIPIAFFRDLLVDPNFGVLPTGVFLALGIVGPVIFCFYLAFGLLEDSGYLPRLSILLNRTFRKMGLNGKGVVPLTMGFSCVTMAILTTRILDTKKEKNIASFLLFLAVPCAPLIAVMLTILDRMPFIATLTVFGCIAIQIFAAGVLANKILPGEHTPLLLEIPPLRVPKPRLLLRSAAQKTYYFMKEAVPVFVLASVLVFVFQRVGGLQLMGHVLRPVTSSLLGLPEDSVQVFLKTIVRRENGAAELLNLSEHYTNLQSVVCLLVMTFMIPCFNSTMVLYKERGGRITSVIVVAVMMWAIILGTFVNHFCTWAGITFS
ncbi:MAG: ferrous iron transporter B [Candidatus Riflebacteria bacterium]|nr:ferrous iron transporter B [Candidatus Riflebacteria bacterium]